MTLELYDIVEKYKKHPNSQKIADEIRQSNNFQILLKGLSGSSASLVAANILKEYRQVHFLILSDREDAAYFYNDLLNCLNETEVHFFPSSYKRSIQYEQTDNGQIILRTNTLSRLNEYTGGLLAIVTYPEALLEKVISKADLESNTLHLSKGENISIGFVREIMETYHFEQVDFVYEPGQYAIRGSIVDIFSFSAEYPYRIDFFGDEVDSIRSFDVESQLSKKKHEGISIIPNMYRDDFSNSYLSILNFGNYQPVIWSDDFQLVSNRMKKIQTSLQKSDTGKE